MKNKNAVSRKEFRKYLLSIIDTESFSEYLASAQNTRIEGVDNDYLNSFFSNRLRVSEYTIFDVLDNEEFGRLVKSVHKLSRKCEVEFTSKKPRQFRNKDVYIPLAYEERRTVKFADIKFPDDEYFASLRISCVPIDSWKMFVQYEFTFKDAANDDLAKFVKDRLAIGSKRDYWPYVGSISKPFFGEQDAKSICDNAFRLICQSFITSNLYSKNGQTSYLPSLKSLVSKEEFDFLHCQRCGSYENAFVHQNNFAIVIKSYGNDEALLLLQNNSKTAFEIVDLVAKYGPPFFYNFFGPCFFALEKSRVSLFTSGKKKPSFKDLSGAFVNWDSFEFRLNEKNDFKEELKKEWTCLESPTGSFWEFMDLPDLENFYKNSYEYIKTIYSLNHDKVTRRYSLIAIIIAFIGVIVAVILPFITAQM